MSFKVVNKIDRDFRWDNGSNPYGFNIPFPTTEDNGKVLSVVEGNYSLAAGGSGGEQTIYFDLRLATSDSTLSVTDTEYTAAQINNLVYAYSAPVVLRVQYDETDEYRLFSLYRIEESDHVTKWCSTVSTDNSGVEIYNDLINITDEGTLTFERRTVKSLTAGDGIEISESNVISAVQPTTSVILLNSASNQVLKDGYSNSLQITDRDYDEIIIEIGAVPNMSYDLYTLVKGGCISVDPEKMNSKYLRGIKSKVPSDSPLWEVIQPYMFDNLVVYSKRASGSDLNNHLFAVYASSYKQSNNTYITIDCVADDSSINLFPNNNIFIWGIKTV